jgi:hypothetical protein
VRGAESPDDAAAKRSGYFLKSRRRADIPARFSRSTASTRSGWSQFTEIRIAPRA